MKLLILFGYFWFNPWKLIWRKIIVFESNIRLTMPSNWHDAWMVRNDNTPKCVHKLESYWLPVTKFFSFESLTLHFSIGTLKKWRGQKRVSAGKGSNACEWMKKSTNAHVHQFWPDRTLISVLRSCWSQSIGNVKSPKRNKIWMLSYLLSSIWMKLKFDLKIVFITKIWDKFWKYHENFHIVWFVLSTLNRISEP